MTTAPISQYQTELLARARARIARSRVQYGNKVAYPDDMQLMLDLVGQIESLTNALQVEFGQTASRGGPTEADPDRPYCKPDQSCCDFCCGN